MLSSRLLWTLSLTALFALGGCRFGSAAVTHDFEALSFAPNGTVFAYVDERDAFHADKETPRVVVTGTWLVINPNADLSDLGGAELDDMQHEYTLREAFALVLDDQADVDDNADFSLITEGDVVVDGGGMSLQLHLPPERLDAASRYATFVPYGSRRVVDVDIEEVIFGDGGVVRGSVIVDIERSERDVSDAKTGRIELSFTAPLVDELIAEKNLATLGAPDVVAVPWAPTESAP